MVSVLVFRKFLDMRLYGYVERLVYVYVIFRSDICLVKRVVLTEDYFGIYG